MRYRILHFNIGPDFVAFGLIKREEANMMIPVYYYQKFIKSVGVFDKSEYFIPVDRVQVSQNWYTEDEALEFIHNIT